jgi:homopolymeric O-antigen transport system permease protein
VAEAATKARRRNEEVSRGATLVIKPRRGWSSLQLRELWSYRELLLFLSWRDVLIRYKQAVLGVAWAILNPVITMVVFTMIFGRLLGVSSGSDLPYAIFSYSALLPWNLFSGALTRSSVSLVARANLLTKVYFPRLVIPFSAVLAGIVDFVIAFVILLVLMPLYDVPYSWTMLWVPALMVLCLLTALSVSLWLSALNVLYRDVQYIVPFLIQLGMYISPVIYPPSKIPPGFARVVYSLNPMTGVIQGFRWAVVGDDPPSTLIIVSIVVTLVLLVTGTFYFKRMERVFADVV